MATDLVMVASHDHRLVALSVLISILAAYAARELVERIRDARGRAWLGWFIGGATVDGIGTWSMHYTGMLAFRLPVPVWYDWPTVLLSLLVGILGSAAALLAASRGKIGSPRALAASIFLGSVGISGLHYTAMAAMRQQAKHHYALALVLLSVVLAIVISSLAVALTFLFRDGTFGRSLRHHGSALLRGAANPVMHYTAMAAVSFTLSSELPDLSHAVSIASVGIVGISVVPVMVLVVALLTSLIDRLQKQRALLDELFEQAPQAVALMDVDGRVMRVNREFTRVFGYTPQATLGRRISELIVLDEARAEWQKYTDLVARGQRVDAEGVRQREDRSHLYVSIVHVPVSLPGGRVVVYAIYRDITERRRAEEKLREYEKVVEGSEQMIAVVDRDYRYLIANRAFLSYRGMEREQVVGHLASEVLNEEVFENVIKPKLDECFQGKVVRYEVKYTYPKLGELDLFLSYFPIEGPNGIDRVACILQDITEQKHAGEQLRRSNKELRALSARLQSVREEESLRIAREIHDELGGALTGLKIDLSWLGKRLPEEWAQQKLKAMSEFIDENMQKVRNIATELRPSVLDDLGLVAAIEWQVREFQKRTEIECKITALPEDLTLSAEKSTAVFRIFQEMLTNVARHARATLIEISMAEHETELLLKVSDNGRGIKESELAAPRSLGLLGMRERALVFGGRVDITGAEGRGTTVTVSIPRE